MEEKKIHKFTSKYSYDYINHFAFLISYAFLWIFGYDFTYGMGSGIGKVVDK